MSLSLQATNIINDIKGQINFLTEVQLTANKVGKSALNDVVKSSIEYTMIDEEIIALKQSEQELLYKLSTLTAGNNVDVKEEKLPEISFNQWNKEEVKESVIKNNPEIAILEIEKIKAESEIALREKEYIPDLELGLSYMQRDNTPAGERRSDMISAMATINIPLWYKKKNMNMVSEAQRKKEYINKLIEDQKNTLNTKTEIILSRLKKWEELYKLYLEQLIPQTELVIETYLSRLTTAKTEVMPIIDSIRLLLEYKKDVAMAKKEYLINLSELKALMGMEVLK